MRLKNLAISTTLLISCTSLSAFFGKQTNPATTTPNSQAITVLREASEGFSEVAEKAIPAVVSIKAFYDASESQDPAFNDFFYHFFGPTPQQEPSIGYGSGFFITADGYILTNNHIVKNASKITVSLHNGSEYEAEIIGSDPNTEVALIKVKGNNFPYLTLADADKIRIGQWAIAIGNPFEFDASVTVGVVSAVGRNRVGTSTWENYIQTDAAINPGNSGGPLLNINCEVIGINTAIYTRTGGYMGLSFAIPSNIAQHVAEQLLKHGYLQRGYLGIHAQSLTPDLAKTLNLDNQQGVIIIEVSPNSPAAKAGLQDQDVILKINGKPLTNHTNLTHEISMMSPGTKITLTINRDGKTKEIEATVGSHPLDGKIGENIANPQNNLGIEVQNLTPEYARQLGYDQISGVIITHVKPNSQMAMASVRPGTLILSVNRQKINSVEEFYQAMKEAAKNKNVLLLVRYGKITRYITINLK